MISAPAEVIIACISQKCGFVCKDLDSGGSSVFPYVFLHPMRLPMFLKLSPSLKWRPKGTTHTRLPMFSRRQENQEQKVTWAAEQQTCSVTHMRTGQVETQVR